MFLNGFPSVSALKWSALLWAHVLACLASAQADPVPLPLTADRCAIAHALVGAPAEGCLAPGYEAEILRSLGGVEPGQETGGYWVHFPFDSNDIDLEAQAHLRRLGEVLTGQLPDLCVLLVGHADTTGTAAYNLGLSERRATSVRLYLAGPGLVASHRLNTMGQGEAQPLPDMPGADPRNRRVEVLAKRASDGVCS